MFFANLKYLYALYSHCDCLMSHSLHETASCTIFCVIFTPLCGGVNTQEVNKHKSVYVFKSVTVCVKVRVVSFITACHVISIDCMEVKVICVPSVIYCVDADITAVMEHSPDRGLMMRLVG